MKRFCLFALVVFVLQACGGVYIYPRPHKVYLVKTDASDAVLWHRRIPNKTAMELKNEKTPHIVVTDGGSYIYSINAYDAPIDGLIKEVVFDHEEIGRVIDRLDKLPPLERSENRRLPVEKRQNIITWVDVEFGAHAGIWFDIIDIDHSIKGDVGFSLAYEGSLSEAKYQRRFLRSLKKLEDYEICNSIKADRKCVGIDVSGYLVPGARFKRY